MKTKKQFVLVLFVVIVVTALLTWTVNNFIVYGLTDETTGKFRTATQIIQRNSFNKVTDIALQEGSIRGMVESLNDPHSAYLTAEEAAAFKSNFLAEYTGIGITTTKIISGFMISEVAKNSPAEQAGLQVQDIIIGINGSEIEVDDQTISDYLKKSNSVKSLTLLRGTEEIIVEITEATVDYISSISQLYTYGDKNILVFNLQRFSDRTVELLTKDLEKLKDKAITGVVFDLRNNTGSSVAIAQSILEKTISNKKPFLTLQKWGEKDGEPELKNEKFTSANEKFQITQPMVILVNEKTASSAEIVASAYNQIEKVPLVGNKTYGKSSIQEVITMNDGSAIKLTTQKWLLPDGNSLTEGEGLQPTENTIDSLPYTVLTVGATKEYKLGDRDTISSSVIADTQMVLSYFGYDTARADGLFDKKTEEQLQRFQEENGIKNTGRIDSATLFVMNKKLIEYTSNTSNDITLQKGLEVVTR